MCISLWVNKAAYLSSSGVFSTAIEVKMDKSRLWELSVIQQAKCESLNKGINFKHEHWFKNVCCPQKMMTGSQLSQLLLAQMMVLKK